MVKNKLHDYSGEKKDQALITVDTSGNITGSASRSECHTGEGRPHLAFVAFILDSENNIILTRRSAKKSLWPLHWDASTISHVLPGETVEEATNRRGKEELGVDVKFKDLGTFYYRERYNESSENEYCHVLVGKTIKTAEFNTVEIAEIKTVHLNLFLADLKNNPGIFTPWLRLALKDKNIKNKLVDFLK